MAAMEGSEKLLKALQNIANGMGNGYVDVGFMENATYPDGTGVAEVAFTNEFGVPSQNQPPRPFFRNMIEEEKETWGPKMARMAGPTNYDGEVILGLMGEDIKDALKESINELVEPRLAQSTIDKKGFDKPLIDSNHMHDSVAAVVNTDGH